MNKMTISAAIFVAAALVLTGCSPSTQAVTVGDAPVSTASAAPVEAGAKKVLTAEQANAALVTAEQVGIGWVAGSSIEDESTSEPDDSTYSPASCAFSTADGGISGIAVVDPGQEPVVEAKATFQPAPADGDTFGLDMQEASVSVASYPDEIDASKFDGISEKLAECAAFTSTDSTGVTSSWQIFPTSLPNYGDGTLAFRLQGSVSMFVVLVDVVMVASGHNLITITQAGLGEIDTDLGGRVAEQVMANLDAATK